MARKTFGRSGQSLVIDDTNVGETGSTVERTSFVDVNSGATYDTDTSDGSESGTDTGTVGETVDDVGDEPRVSEYTDPNTATSPRTGKPKRKYTKRSAKATTSAESTKIISANLEKVLYNLHVMGAALLSEPDLKITQDDAVLLSEAVKEVATAYDFTKVLNEKNAALVDLGIACMTVYGERAINIYHKHTRKPGQVVNMPQQTQRNG